MTIGIVAGLPAELAAFAPAAPGETIDHGPLAVRRTRWAGHEVALCCAGIGKVAAATAAALLHHRHGAALLLVTGTAAAVRGGPPAAYRITHAVQHDYGARRPHAFARYTAGTIPIGPVVLAPFAALEVPGLDLPTARIASADMFVESPAHAADIAAMGYDLIDMETAAVAQAAALLGLPWAAVKATTDTAGDDSAELFERNLLAAAAAAARGAERLIEALRPPF